MPNTSAPAPQQKDLFLPFQAAAFFAHKDRLARWCVLLAIVALINSIVASVAGYRNARQPQQFIVLDRDDRPTVTNSSDFAAAKEFHIQQALQASTALLLRNPKDFDMPELLQTCFTRRALAQAAALKAAEARPFEEMQYQQKPAIQRIDIRRASNDQVEVTVRGELSRFGVFAGKPFTDVVPFTLDLRLQRNPDLLRNRSQPTLVAEFFLTYETPHS